MTICRIVCQFEFSIYFTVLKFGAIFSCVPTKYRSIVRGKFTVQHCTNNFCSFWVCFCGSVKNPRLYIWKQLFICDLWRIIWRFIKKEENSISTFHIFSINIKKDLCFIWSSKNNLRCQLFLKELNQLLSFAAIRHSLF